MRVRILCDLATYLARNRDNESAIALLEQARCLLADPQGISNDNVYFQISLACVYGATSRWNRALNALSDFNATNHALLGLSPLRVRLLLEAGERQEAHRSLQKIYADLERMPRLRIQVAADKIATHKVPCLLEQGLRF